MRKVFTTLTDQKPQPRRSVPGPPLDLVIGLDFGTAFTKCVVRAPARPGSPAFIIPLGSGPNEARYLLPSKLYRGADGEYALFPVEGATLIDELKSPLIFQGASVPSERAHIVAYLALTLRRTRRWMMENERSFLGDRQVRWSLNLGLPAASHDRDDLEKLYLEIAQLAWSVSTRADPITDVLIRDLAVAQVAKDVVIEIIPEVAAAVTAYARSRQRRDGLHLLIDVGAGTLDACVFRLHDDTGDRVSIFQACVEPLGVIAHQKDPLSVRQSAGMAIRQLLWTTKTRRDPGAREWTEGLRFFMAGGGRKIPEYRQALPSRKNGLSWKDLQFIEVDSQGGLGLRPEVSAELFRRLVVACGLSYEVPNIARIDKPHSIEDAEAPVRRSSHLSPSRFTSGAMQEDDD